MAKELTLYTRDKHWKAEIEAQAIHLRFYNSIGTQVVVYHREQTTSIWGGPETDWEEQPPLMIRIRNVYRGVGPGVATREREWRHRTQAALMEWSAGGPIHLCKDSSSSTEGDQALDVNRIESTVTVMIAGETLTGVVSTSVAASEALASTAA